MAQNRLSGPGVLLPYPQALYPNNLLGSATVPNTSVIDLAAGDSLPIPGGDWALRLGPYTLVQALDPVSQVWLPFPTLNGEIMYIHSDGQNIRLANLTGCPIGAIVTASGSGFTSTPTVTASAGSSTWQAIIGGALSTSVSLSSAGSGYTVPPLVFIAAPQVTASTYGVQASAYAVLTGSSVTSISVTNQGAGYTSAPSISVVASPYDPNIGSVTNATAVGFLTASQSLTAVLCTFNGNPVTTAPTLTIAGGGGTGATAIASMLWTVTSIAVQTAGGGYNSTTGAYITTVGGVPTVTPVFTNPAIEKAIANPRALQALATVTSGSITTITLGTMYDTGLYTGTPTPIIVSNSVIGTAAAVTLTLGSTQDVSFLQPL